MYQAWESIKLWVQVRTWLLYTHRMSLFDPILTNRRIRPLPVTLWTRLFWGAKEKKDNHRILYSPKRFVLYSSLFMLLRRPYGCFYVNLYLKPIATKFPQITTCTRASPHHHPSLSVSIFSFLSHPPLPPLIQRSITQEAWSSWKQALEHGKGQGRGGQVHEGEKRMFLSFLYPFGWCRPHCGPSWGNQAHVTLARPWAHTCCLVGLVWRSNCTPLHMGTIKTYVE